MPWTKLAVRSYMEDAKPAPKYKKKGGREISYEEAIREALFQALKMDENVFLMGEGVDDAAGAFGSTLNLHKDFPGRVFDTPIAEGAVTGFAVGSALCGMRPILVHMRMDFMPLSFDQILNHAAKFCYMSGGKVSVPLVIRAIIGRGWGSAAQHSQGIQALFMHIPGLKVVMPATPFDAKGLLLSSIADNNPVIFIEHRWLYDTKGGVPRNEYLIPIGKGIIRKKGRDVTVVATSLMVREALMASERLSHEGVDIEVIDPRSLKPLDKDIIIDSVKKTGRLIIADLSWRTGGASEMILAGIHSSIRAHLKADVQIVALPDTPTPASHVLEEAFYAGSEDIVKAVKRIT